MLLFKSFIFSVFAFILVVMLEILFFAVINEVFNAGITPRGLGWIILPFLFSIYSYNYFSDLLNKENDKIMDDKQVKIKTFSKKQKNRIYIVLSIFWFFLTLFISLGARSYHWFLSKEMYMFLLFGILPIFVFWSFYWIKNADT